MYYQIPGTAEEKEIFFSKISWKSIDLSILLFIKQF